jgi:hypothetical protein
MAKDEIKRLATRAMRDAGGRHLLPIGATGNRSGRRWTVDRGWWLINIEFQAAGFAVGSYLNVGLQHLWQPRDHRVFDCGDRQPIATYGQFVEFGHDVAANAERADALAASARRAADRWLGLFGDDRKHLKWLTKDKRSYDAGFAFAMLGRTPAAAKTFAGLPATLDATIEWQARLAADCAALARLVPDATSFMAETNRRVQSCRSALRLPDMPSTLPVI